MSLEPYTCPGCRKTSKTDGLCAFCRTAYLELRPLREMDLDELLATVRGTVRKWGTPLSLTVRETDAVMIAVHEIDYRASRGTLPADWEWPGDQLDVPPPRGVETLSLPD